MIGRELHLLTAISQSQLLDRHHAGVVDEDVERSLPRGDEGVDAGEIGQFQSGDRNLVVAGAGADVRSYLLGVTGPANGERDRRPRLPPRRSSQSRTGC
jgi:hypothetical protein